MLYIYEGCIIGEAYMYTYEFVKMFRKKIKGTVVVRGNVHYTMYEPKRFFVNLKINHIAWSCAAQDVMVN